MRKLTIIITLYLLLSVYVYSKQTKPNIIVILADDLAYFDISYFGQKNYSTPNIDKLAKEGCVFSNAFSGGAWSAPSRTALLTGLNSSHFQPIATDTINNHIKFNPTIAEALKTVGYKTFICGKWHMLESFDSGLPGKKTSKKIINAHMPWNRGFDVCRITYTTNAAGASFPSIINTGDSTTIIIPENINITDQYVNNAPKLKEKLYNSKGLFVDTMGNDGKHLKYGEELLRTEATRFIQENKTKPFFMLYASPLVHRPLVAKDISMYSDKPSEWTLAHKVHAAMVSEIDKSVGEIMNEIIRQGLDKNTIIIFASDNGFTSEGWWNLENEPQKWEASFWKDIPLFKTKGPWDRGKHVNSDGGVIVPCIAWCPALVKQGETDRAISFHDFKATFNELAGVKMKDKTDGMSFISLLKGNYNKQKTHKPIFWGGQTCLYGAMEDNWEGSQNNKKEYLTPDAALIDEHWFVLYFRNKNRTEPTIRIFDLRTDPSLSHDLSKQEPVLYRKVLNILSERD